MSGSSLEHRSPAGNSQDKKVKLLQRCFFIWVLGVRPNLTLPRDNVVGESEEGILVRAGREDVKQRLCLLDMLA